MLNNIIKNENLKIINKYQETSAVTYVKEGGNIPAHFTNMQFEPINPTPSSTTNSRIISLLAGASIIILIRLDYIELISFLLFSGILCAAIYHLCFENKNRIKNY
jgi:hypothetical protein